MKSRVLRTGISSTIFLLLVTAVLFVIQPIYKKVSNVINQNKNNIITSIENKYGLGISYESLSPSILSGIHAKNIGVYDVQSKEQILSIDKAILKYKLFTILKGDFENAFTELVISGIDCDLQTTRNATFISKLQKKSSTNDVSTNSNTQLDTTTLENNAFFSETVTNTIKEFLFALPLSIRIKKFKCSYENENQKFSVGINKLFLEKDIDGKLITSRLNGFVTMSLPNNQTAGFAISLDGKLLNDISGSSAMCTLGEYSKADYSIGHGEYLFRYSNHVLMFQSLYNTKPFSLSGAFDIDTGDLTGNLYVNKFNPFSFILLKKHNSLYKSIYGSLISGKYSISYNIPSNVLFWNADGSLELSKKLTPNGQSFTYSINGDNQNVYLTELTAKGSIVDATFTGSYNIPKQLPMGSLNLTRYTLPNGNNISGELYVDQTNNGFMCFIPQLFLKDETLTAVQLDIIPSSDAFDFSLSVSDYSHSDFDTPGEIKIDGSLSLGEQQYLQSSVNIGNVFVDSGIRIASVFVDRETENKLHKFAKNAEPFIFTNELYFSTDFKTITYNSPYSVIANTRKEKQLLLLSLDGNENSCQVSQFDLIYGNQTIEASAGVDFYPKDKEIMFNTDCIINSLPYHFSGNFINKWLNINGDYGFEVALNMNKEIDGNIQFNSFPIQVGNNIISSTTDISFLYTTQNGFNGDIRNFEIEEIGGKIKIKPKLNFRGSINNYGLLLSSVSYSDTLSMLYGKGQVLWNMNDGQFDSVSLNIQVDDGLGKESIDLDGTFSNPTHVALDTQHILEDCYFTSDIVLSQFPMSRFMIGQLPDNTFSGQISAGGTLGNPYISAKLDNLSIQVNGIPLVVNGSSNVEDKVISLSNFNLKWGGVNIKASDGIFDLNSFTGNILADLNINLNNKQLKAPFTIKLENNDTSRTKLIPDDYYVMIESQNISGSLLNQSIPLKINLHRKANSIDITSEGSLGITGTYLDGGQIYCKIDESQPVHFVANGNLNKQLINLNITNFFCDMSQISSTINTGFFSVYEGIMRGEVQISGLLIDPDLSGNFVLDKVDFNIPDFIPAHMYADKVICSLSQDELLIPQTAFFVNDSILYANLNMKLDRWSLESIRSNFSTEGSRGVPVDFNIPFVRIKGKIEGEADLVIEDGVCGLKGAILLQKSELTALVNFNDLSEDEETDENQNKSYMDYDIDLQILVGSRVQVVLNPILRGLVAPQTKIEFTMNSLEGIWSLKGDVVLRGGEVTYLSRSFYLKEGRIVMNESQSSFDPNITVRAETKERDEEGDPVTITLSAIRQNASNFKPILSSTPAKSENEIMSILGQIVTADSTANGKINVSNLLFASLDYGVQVTLLRQGENALRDLLNFDILSIRTMFIQNTLKQSLNREEDTANKFTFGNFFDNSTVYIGKYFGSSLYADALLQWTYDDTKYEKDNPVSGIMFQPEVGFELSSPFANIRWSFAPDLGSSIINSLVPATSITLSWKFSF